MVYDELPEPQEERLPKLAECEARIGYKFKDQRLLLAALTHASGAQHRLISNERLEFLGDSILGVVVCEMLYHRFPEYLEGDLTKIKSAVVSRQSCARISKELGLEEYLFLGKGMTTAPTLPRSLLSDVLESLIAALYLDGGMQIAAEFIEKHIASEIEHAVHGELYDNYKSTFQQLVQREYGTTPNYQLVEEKGPDHSKCFRVAAEIDGKSFPPAWGRNKKEAEQRAARNALSQLAGEPIPFPE